MGLELINIATRALDVSHGVNQDNDPAVLELLEAQVFGASVKALAKLPSSEWSERVDLPTWIKKAVGRWPKSQAVLSGLVVLSGQ